MKNDDSPEGGLTRIESAPLSTHLQELLTEARQIIAEGVPKNTWDTYDSQWRTFHAWCLQHGRSPLPAASDTVTAYLTERSHEVKVGTLKVALAAITFFHRHNGHPDWTANDLAGVRVFMRSLRRRKGEAPVKKKALTLEELRRGLPADVQERAILLVGFFSALRRSELVALRAGDVSEVPGGVRIYVRFSKGDKEGEGQVTSIPELLDQPDVCPVASLREWLEVSRTKRDAEVPLFFSLEKHLALPDYTVADMVKEVATRLGYNPDHYGAHSLRSGFATSSARAKAEEREIMRVTRHKSERMVREYIQEGTLGKDHPGRQIAAQMLKSAGEKDE